MFSLLFILMIYPQFADAKIYGCNIHGSTYYSNESCDINTTQKNLNSYIFNDTSNFASKNNKKNKGKIKSKDKCKSKANKQITKNSKKIKSNKSKQAKLLKQQQKSYNKQEKLKKSCDILNLDIEHVRSRLVMGVKVNKKIALENKLGKLLLQYNRRCKN